MASALVVVAGIVVDGSDGLVIVASIVVDGIDGLVIVSGTGINVDRIDGSKIPTKILTFLMDRAKFNEILDSTQEEDYATMKMQFIVA